MYLHLFLLFSLNSLVEGGGGGGGGEGYSLYRPIRKATPERGTFSRLRVYERVGISLVEICHSGLPKEAQTG